MNDLQEELILTITNFLKPKQIVLLNRINKQFSKLDTKSLIIKHNSKHFPRPEGQAKVHQIKYKSCQIEDIYDETDVKEKITRAVYCCYNDGTDLVKGDIFKFDESSPTGTWQGINAIFDGEQMIPYKHNTSVLLLPSSLHVIENKVPIRYWDITFNNHWCLYKFDTVVLFNHSLIKQQCLDNIKYNKILHTTFLFNDIEHKIVYDGYYDHNIIITFQQMLSSDEQITFYHTGITHKLDDLHTLYVR